MDQHAFHDAAPSMVTPEQTEPPQDVATLSPAAKASIFRVLPLHQRRALYGSFWHGGYSAADLKPYLYAARSWVKHCSGEPEMAAVLHTLRLVLDANTAWRMRVSLRLRPRPERERLHIAFRRLRHSTLTAAEILATHMAMAALIREDKNSDQSADFLVVQLGRALMRTSSGHYGRVYAERPDGSMVRGEVSSFFRTSGVVFRAIGSPVENICGGVADAHLLHLLAHKIRTYGPHPSRRPGRAPRWCRPKVGAWYRPKWIGEADRAAS